MAEQELNIQEKGQYKNIDLREMNNESFIVVKKQYAEGRKVSTPKFDFYSCSVEYKGEVVTFGLYEEAHDEYTKVGGEGDHVKITCFKEMYQDAKKQDKVKRTYKFEKVE